MGCTLLVLLLVILLQAFSTTTTVSVSDKSDDYGSWELPCRRCKLYMRVISSGRAAAPPVVAAAALPESPTSSGKKTNVGEVVGLTFLLVFIFAIIFVCIYRSRKSPSSSRTTHLNPFVAQPPQALELVHIPATTGFAQQGGEWCDTNKEVPWEVKPNDREHDDDEVVRPKVPKHTKDDDKVVRPNVPKHLKVDRKVDVEVAKNVIREGKKPQEIVVEQVKNCLGLPKIFTFKYLSRVTNKFDSTNRIGGGGFGTVYWGTLADGTVVAVKCLQFGGRIDDFKNEVDALAKANHCNLVKLIGYCDEGITQILVYEYMPNGSLEKWIFNTEIDKFLNWPEMKNIIRGVAKGLEYLHKKCEKKILHRDLKPANIILDENKNAKLCDFGFAKFLNKDQSSTSTAWAGTKGYMAPESKTDRIGDKVDVYSFGAVLLEIMFGKRCDKLVTSDEINNVKDFKFNGLIRNLREDLKEDGKEIAMFGKLAMFCLNEKPEKRPNITDVVKTIDRLEAGLKRGKPEEYEDICKWQ